MSDLYIELVWLEHNLLICGHSSCKWSSSSVSRVWYSWNEMVEHYECLQKPVVNSKFHRRSKSSGEVWLDHRPSGTVEIGEFCLDTWTRHRRRIYRPHVVQFLIRVHDLMLDAVPVRLPLYSQLHLVMRCSSLGLQAWKIHFLAWGALSY